MGNVQPKANTSGKKTKKKKKSKKAKDKKSGSVKGGDVVNNNSQDVVDSSILKPSTENVTSPQENHQEAPNQTSEVQMRRKSSAETSNRRQKISYAGVGDSVLELFETSASRRRSNPITRNENLNVTNKGQRVSSYGESQYNNYRSRAMTDSHVYGNDKLQTRSRSLTTLKNKNKLRSDERTASNGVKLRNRPKSNSEYNEFRRRSLPVHLQKQLRKESLMTNNRNSLSQSTVNLHDYRKLKVPFLFPFNKKLCVKLVPPKDGPELKVSTLKHILFLRLETQDRKLVKRTGQLYKASILFTEGNLREVVNRETGQKEKRLVQAQIWSGLSQSVEFEDDVVRITGYFMSGTKGMIPYLEFELELKPNFKNIRSEDTGYILFAVGVFSFIDTRSVVNKMMQWHAVIENWKRTNLNSSNGGGGNTE
eukprot:TCONS_00024701-protein